MKKVEDFKELVVFDQELIGVATPIDNVGGGWYLDIGRNVGVSYDQRRILTLMDGILNPLRFKRCRNTELQCLQWAKFYTPLLRDPSDGTPLDTSKLWSLKLVEAGRRSFKKL
jgi:hypothetical protein